jgi:guanine nucleotide-binding protein subunit alpha
MADFIKLLGAGESGKSTILKQMKLIYSQGFSKSEKLEWKPVIFSNIVQSFQTIGDAMSELGIMFENPENEVRRVALLPAARLRHPIPAHCLVLLHRSTTATE